ncbi:MAG TPA: response regulator [Opitutaceae bacterium]|nr:response regulator [Opitutaceae bacterium]
MELLPPPPDILVVDDDDGLRLLIDDALREAGYAVRTAQSAAAAIAAIRSRRPDLVLLDLQLKDAGGPELIARLRREQALAPFVVVTGQGSEKVAVEMMKQGALDYVMKDTAILDLLPAVVRRALAQLERERALGEAEAERRRLEAQILEISENERRQFGADLHDGIGQQLTAIQLMCVGLKGDVAALDRKLGDQLARIADALREAVAQTRAMSRGLAPLDEAPDALQTGLAGLAAQIDGAGRVRCRAELPARPVDPGRAEAVHLFRIAQEAVNNAVKHSGATEVVIRLEAARDRLGLAVADNGRGLPDEAPKGLGLRLMRYRAGKIGAELSLESRPGTGLTVRCVLPIKKP